MDVPESPDTCSTETRVNNDATSRQLVAGEQCNKPMAPSLVKKPIECKQQQQEARTACLFDIPATMLTQRHPSLYNVHMITAQQYAELYSTFMSTPLPNDILFPWLHGVDGQYYLQNLFFGVDQVEIPRHRGMMIVHADSMYPHHARIVHSVLPHEILDDATSDDSSFVDTSRGPNVHLRNFKIQIARYATISDIVVYGCDAHAVATRIVNAQTKLRERRIKEKGNDSLLEYRVLMIQDPFSVIEEHYPHLVGHDSRGVCIHNISFSERERKEIRAMSEANEITSHVWVGNSNDVPGSARSLNDDLFDNDDYYNSDDEMENPYQFSICIESYDLAEMPQPSTLMLARETLNDLPSEELPIEIIHLEALCSFTPTSTASFDQFFAKLIRLLEFIDDQASVHGRYILIHCSDGYSETSLLVLSWIMYKLRIRLPEAYLFLQERRSFFVLASNILVLQLIEHSIFHQVNKPTIEMESQKRKRDDYEEQQNQPDKRDGRQSNATISVKHQDVKATTRDDMTNNDDDHATTPNRLDYLPLVSDHRQLYDDTYLNIVSNQLTPSSALQQHDNHSNDTQTVTLPMHESIHISEDNNDISENNTTIAIPAEDNEIWTHNLSSPLLPPIDPQELVDFPWFYSSRFEGSFPSRILPNLYLGNLNHATNPDMLKALQITHVVSVGEHSGLDPSQFHLLLLDNLYDDGIDSIRGRWNQVTQFIEQAKGANCLIHCRVGVSRSAAITIGYIMKQLGMSLVQAYLFVRARRLNVIIQPNLKFMYELLQLELELFGKMSIPWPSLCKQIHLINISCDP